MSGPNPRLLLYYTDTHNYGIDLTSSEVTPTSLGVRVRVKNLDVGLYIASCMTEK